MRAGIFFCGPCGLIHIEPSDAWLCAKLFSSRQLMSKTHTVSIHALDVGKLIRLRSYENISKSPANKEPNQNSQVYIVTLKPFPLLSRENNRPQ
jgi:hypothetical protein